jgi:hypothetical protein
MKTVFVGGSRAITRLHSDVAQRLRNIVDGELTVLVGDANGADKAVQRFFAESEPPYEKVEVFCSGSQSRNNLGKWRERHVDAGNARGFAFYAAKDAAMAREADVGLVIWDSKSPGTLKQVERMATVGKTVVVYVNPERRFLDIKGDAGWKRFVSTLPSEVRALMERKPEPPSSASRQPGLF